MRSVSKSLIVIASLAVTSLAGVPTAIFHGFGDSCIFPGMWEFTDQIANVTNAYATCVEIGWGTTTSIFENFETQAEEACRKVQADPNFQGEFNVVGLSQGGLLARHIVERCTTQGQPRNLITIGAPNFGVSASPHCFSGMFCDMINYVIDNMVYFSYLQDNIGPAGYFRDPADISTYLEYSVFLPYLNNERAENFTQSINNRFTGLNGAMFIMFSNDTMIYPKETAWFYQLEADYETITPVTETEFYKQDLIGLKTLNEAGKVQFVEWTGDHLQFSFDKINTVLGPFLNK
ncbi:hypothetical protein FGO68_gene5727 [Halteria grandinella]|uniref:Palmitoyl-protein thioesterase 1 n=1 Tax=Halteria grandinella TaxID=5974 RepID=A0A8J8NJ84_HALGN|nr:hypothetical protein FGO68_gene5727 [Halteria grandinella]